MKSAARAHALEIFKASLRAADPKAAVLRHVHLDGGILTAGRARYVLNRFDNIIVVGAGKAGAPMAQAIEKLLGLRIRDGLVNVKYGHTAPLKGIELNECGHPIPDENGSRGAQRIAALAQNATARDLVVCLISGGASALLPLPLPGIALAGKRELTGQLLASGADIHEINCVRKHLSAIKGGRLAQLAYPATVLTLILSDVIGDDLDVIGSGPTVPDSSTLADAFAVLRRYGIDDAPLRAAGSETPKPGDRAFRKVRNIIVGSNRLAVDAAAAKARSLGYRTLVLSTFIEGETREVARVHAAILKEVVASGRPVRRPCCLVSGGEATVTIRGSGLGGRNQEFVLAAALDIDSLPGATVFSAGTDGTDGPTDAAGAVADGQTIARAARLGMNARDYLTDNDSYRFFEQLGDLVKTGPTGTNVADVRLLLVDG